MLTEAYYTLFNYVDSHDPVGRCWTSEGFDISKAGSIPHVYVGFAAASYCHATFMNEGLAGLLESECAQAVPEFCVFLRFLGCGRSADVLEHAVTLYLPTPYPRDLTVRWALVESHLAVLDGEWSQRFEESLNEDGFEGTLNSFCDYHCKRLGLVVGENASEHDHLAWDRPFRFSDG